jgi:aromatic-L-amino-acid decarboxylase
MTEHGPAMSPEEFKRNGQAVLDWIADYRVDEEGHRPVQANIDPGSVYDSLPSSAPLHPESFEAVMADVDRVLRPGLTHWQSPDWFAYFPSNGVEPSVLADLLSSGMGVQGMLWATSPACTELEMRVLDWTVEALGLPPHFRFDAPGPGGGVLQDTASSAVLACMVAARERATDGQSNIDGVDQRNRPLVAYVSSQAHSSLEKAARISGIGSSHLRLIEVDDAFAMKPEALEAAITEDLARGYRPFFICATLGTTGTGAFDPVDAIGALAERHGCWFHVDAAMFGTAALCPEYRSMHEGVERADSWSFNPHKWMGATFDCSCLWLRDATALTNAMSIHPTYLDNRATASGEVVDYRDWHVQLGRRFRALKLWFLYRCIGLEGLRAMVRHHVSLTQELVEWIDADPDWNRSAPTPLTLTCIQHRAGSEITKAVLEAVNDSGELALTHCELDGEYTLRLVIGQWNTTIKHVRAAWDRIVSTAAEFTSSS